MPHQLKQYLYKVFDSEDGVEISGGEAQKLAIACAIYKDAPFIIFDEPTAALDPIAEYDSTHVLLKLWVNEIRFSCRTDYLAVVSVKRSSFFIRGA